MTEIQFQIQQNLFVNDVRQSEDLRANVGRLIAGAEILKILALLLEVPEILRQILVEFVMIVVDEHFTKLYRVQIVPIFDLGYLLKHEVLPDLILKPSIVITLGLKHHPLSQLLEKGLEIHYSKNF